MSVIELPTASAVSDESSTVMDTVDVTAILAASKSLETPDLFKVIKEYTKEAEKRVKGVKSTGPKRTTKSKDEPKGKTPRQLRKNNAWVAFTLKHALENGWEAFVVHSTKKDKETGDKFEEEVEMPASVLHDGAYVYDGSVTESTPTGKQIIHKEAMSLSKQRKENHPSWEEFLASYEEEPASETESVATKATTSTKTTVRMTAAEKAAAKAEKDAIAAKEKEEKAAARLAKKAASDEKKRLEAEAVAARKAERAAAKAEKEAAKEAAKAAKEAEKVGKAPVKVAAPVKAVAKAAVPAKAAVAAPVKAAVAAPVKAAGGAGAKKPIPVIADEWVPPTAEGGVKSWSYKGKVYLRNADNELWLKTAGGIGAWQGVYIPAEDRIDDSIPEPVFEDEE